MNPGCQIISTRQWMLPHLWSWPVKRSSLWIHTTTSRPGFCFNAQPRLRPRSDPTGQKTEYNAHKQGFPSPPASGVNDINPTRLDATFCHSWRQVKSRQREELIGCDEPYYRFWGSHRQAGVFMSPWLQKCPRWATTWSKWTQVRWCNMAKDGESL